MADYSGVRRRKKLFSPAGTEPFELSRSKIDAFLNCPRCFYLDRRLGVSQPSGPAFTLNVAVDALLKKEFDIHRAAGRAHPLMEEYGVDAVPFDDPRLSNWRNNFEGVRFLHTPTNFLVFGAIDDLWITPDKHLYIVDYKATAKAGEIVLENTKWHNQYRRQMEIYQWLFRQNGFQVSDTGYFVYVNGKKDRAAFDKKLEFDVTLLPYEGHDDWVPDALIAARDCLMADVVPASAPDCDYCSYRKNAAEAVKTL